MACLTCFLCRLGPRKDKIEMGRVNNKYLSCGLFLSWFDLSLIQACIKKNADIHNASCMDHALNSMGDLLKGNAISDILDFVFYLDRRADCIFCNWIV